MTFLVLISLLLSSGSTTLTDDVVFEYSRLEFTDLEGVGFNDTLIPALGITDSRPKPNRTNYREPSSAELNRLFYRCPRDRLLYAWRST